MGRGLFISFEGIDGSGKGTQIERAVTWLSEQYGSEPLQVREPGGTGLGEQIRSLLLHGDHMSPTAEALLYASARAELVAQRLRPALNAGRVVVADRYVHSSIAYQGAGRELGVARVAQANELATGGLSPDLVILLDIEPEVAAARVRAAREASGEAVDRLEEAGLEFFTRVAAAYRELAIREHERFVVLDATRDVDELAVAIQAAIAAAFDRQSSGALS